MLAIEPIVLPGTALDEIRDYLRIEPETADPSLAALAHAAVAHAEAFTAQLLLRRGATERLTATGQWQRLAAWPVAAITSVTGIPAEGASFLLAPDAYAIDIDASGDGWVRVIQPGGAGRIDVVCQAGLAANWGVLPEAVRLGIMRLVGHLHAYRDDNDDRGPPAAVSALLRPWRRIRL
jgi:uncharacterized phiE125 gp8 family phage protein